MATMVEAAGGFSATANRTNHLNASSSWPSTPRTRLCRVAAPIQRASANDRACISGHRAVLPIFRGLRKIQHGRLAPQAAMLKVGSARSRKQVVCEAQETVTAAAAVNQSTFQKLVLESDIPVLVDFWAPWCGPCRMIAPLIDELARQYAGKLKCLKLNTDDCPDIATEYGIRSIPTVMIFVNGEKKDTVIGAVPKSTLTTAIEKYLDW